MWCASTAIIASTSGKACSSCDSCCDATLTCEQASEQASEHFKVQQGPTWGDAAHESGSDPLKRLPDSCRTQGGSAKLASALLIHVEAEGGRLLCRRQSAFCSSQNARCITNAACHCIAARRVGLCRTVGVPRRRPRGAGSPRARLAGGCPGIFSLEECPSLHSNGGTCNNSREREPCGLSRAKVRWMA